MRCWKNEKTFGILKLYVHSHTHTHLASSHFAFSEYLFCEPLLCFHLFISSFGVWFSRVQLDEIQIHDKATEACLIHSCWWNLNEKCQCRCEVSFLCLNATQRTHTHIYILYSLHASFEFDKFRESFYPNLTSIFNMYTHCMNIIASIRKYTFYMEMFLIPNFCPLYFLHAFCSISLLITAWTLIYLPSIDIKMSFWLESDLRHNSTTNDVFTVHAYKREKKWTYLKSHTYST